MLELVTLNHAESGTYQIGDHTVVIYTGSESFTIGSDMNAGDKKIIYLTATNGTTVKEAAYTFEKVEQSNNIVYL